jgi:hypothetical protein
MQHFLEAKRALSDCQRAVGMAHVQRPEVSHQEAIRSLHQKQGEVARLNRNEIGGTGTRWYVIALHF